MEPARGLALHLAPRHGAGSEQTPSAGTAVGFDHCLIPTVQARIGMCAGYTSQNTN